MTVAIGRRELLAALGGAAAAWPLVARAQQRAAMPVVGYLDFYAAEPTGIFLAAFHNRLRCRWRGKRLAFVVQRLGDLGRDLAQHRQRFLAVAYLLQLLRIFALQRVGDEVLVLHPSRARHVCGPRADGVRHFRLLAQKTVAVGS